MSITFNPYIGPLYRDAAVRLVILGESHYGEPSENPAESTCEVVEGWRTDFSAIRYLTIAARILSGLEAWQLDRTTALDKVVFYNFIQVSMPDILIRPTIAQARASWDAFREMLATCDPTHMIATGQRFLWDNMPAADGRSGTSEYSGEFIPWREYATPSGLVSTIALPHFSRASAPRWHRPVQLFLTSERS